MSTTPRIYLSAPDVGEAEQENVARAITSGWVAPLGPDLTAFEEEIARRVDRTYAVGLASGTSALHLALLHWGVGPGDVVPVSTMTFAATVNAIAYVGATPYFVDSEPESGNISADLLEQALDSLGSQGVRVPVIVPVDLLGKCADYDALSKIAESYGTRLLSDAAESLGASFGDRPAGAFGDAAVLSFNGNKIITTSSGGMLLTDDEAMADHVRKLSTQAREPAVHYEHEEVGYNYRLSNILAALGRAQLTRLDELIARRREWRERYRALFASIPGVRILGGADDRRDNCWLTAIVIDDGANWNPEDLSKALWAEGIETRPVWKPMHQQPVFAGCPGIYDGSADRIFARGLALPSGSAMTEAQFCEIETLIAEFLERLP
ncbi:MAG: aminotransferase class I/II-fold pyridoxal phosphate-dependent enzyme [Nocardioides sp.]|uniref:DegT/DnrJ/EryC1/StrS family aminotransferase n=1 Tax=Nocardioides sp. TaxID=35761 RepID=UPI0039E581DA